MPDPDRTADAAANAADADAAVTADAATTNRRPWSALPPGVRAAVERTAGSPVARTELATAGFSVGFAGLVVFEDGTRRFLKAGDGATNPETARLHRSEARLAGDLPHGIAPELDWMLEAEDWVVVAFEAIDGRQPGPWSLDDLDAVLAAQAAVAAVPGSPRMPSAEAAVAGLFDGWRRVRSGEHAERMPDWASGRLDELVELERCAPSAVAGDALVHLDLRADNVLIERSGRVRIVDWPHACRGAGWTELPFFAPAVVADGAPEGLDAERVFARSPLAAAVERDALRAVVTGWAGRLLLSSFQPAPPGIPTLRAFQTRHAVPLAAWARDLLHESS
ncbi:aminoglycoside phosphotransferase family protein [Agromyces seonyuensis]|uniref:Aminoglycoside phosphotransferase family protein n=1 Tax=Agromyces seonyuensis TaxID=2662446 RepID=A0A6I4P7H1_9MICO|nr:aminoglycoside phosphotransferase family protein [Agromyces seonyuensis]MWB99717.1 aminoglycoside phosphotransferase family protein [Agromyces seonyuensis]